MLETITVITPSLNKASFIEECLQSAASQSTAALEHLVFDPGSIDNSRQIANSFPRVTLITEDDEGQSHAVNKGFKMARGQILAWLNADDYYIHSEVFKKVIARFNKPDQPEIVYGQGIYTDENGKKLRDVYVNKKPETLSWRFHKECGVLQPALFIRRDVVERVGLLSTYLHYCMDYEYWIRCIKKQIRFAYIDEELACFRLYNTNKTYGDRDKSYLEVCDMQREQFGYVNSRWLRLLAEYTIEKLDGILLTRQNTPLNRPDAVEKEFCRLLRNYNTNYDSYNMIQENAKQPGYRETAKEMKDSSISFNTPIYPVSAGTCKETGHVLRNVGTRQWAFDLSWRQNKFDQAHQFLRDRIEKREKDVCVIVGNGPSLNDTDLSLLKGQDVIISNNAFLSKELISYASYYTVVNYLVAEQSCQHINRLDIYKIIPYWLAYCLNENKNTYFIEAMGYPEFSLNMFVNVSWRHTVSFYNLHIAYGLGYRKVVLIGFDHNYIQSNDSEEEDIICSNEKDINHFDPSYFRGKKWQAANVGNMEKMYNLAKNAFEDDGREIINATKGGRLSLFPRQDLVDALKM